jgi:thiamine transport system permease protein
MILLLFAPLFAVIERSLTVGRDTISLAHYFQLGENTRQSILFVPPLQTIGNSLLFAVLTTLMAVLLGLITAILLSRSQQSVFIRWLDPLFMLPLAT